MQKIFYCLVSGLIAIASAGEEVKLQNPSFEEGTGGYWISKPALAKIDTETSSAGLQSLLLDLPADSKLSAVANVEARPGSTYRFSFDSKSSAGAESPKITVSLMLQGKKPIAFWYPSGKSKADFVFTPGEKWERREFVFGPIPETMQKQDVKRLMLYIDVSTTAQAGKVWIDKLACEMQPGEATVKDQTAPQASPSVNPPSPVKAAPSATTPPSPVKAAPLASQASPELKKKSESDSLILELPAPVQVFERPIAVKVAAIPDSPADSTVTLSVSDCREREIFRRQSSAQSGIELELGLPGYYRATARLCDSTGKELALKTSSLTITTPLPDDYYSTPEPAFGVWGLQSDLLKVGGAKWTRQLFFTFFQKPDFQADPPSPEKIAARSPIKVIKCINVLHPFKKMYPVPSDEWPALREKVTKELIASRGLVDVWETQNEPMVGENFHGSMSDVVDIISNTSRLVRSLNPGVPIAGICINPMSQNQYSQITGYYRNYGMANLVDNVMLHPYIPNAAAPDTSGYVDVLNRLGRELNQITGHDVPMYISEIGYSTKPGGEVTELQQAAYLARVILLNRQVKNLRACVWHIGLWNDATSARELDYGILRGHPKNSQLREPKPAFAAWATVSRMTYNASYRGELEFGRGVRVHLFERNGKALLAAYSLTGQPRKLKLPLGGTEVLTTDVCGSPSTQPVNAGVVEVTVDEAPLYIAGNDPADFERLAGLKIEITPDTLRAKPGESITVTLKGTPFAKENVSLKTEVPANWIVRSAAKNQERSVDISIPADASPGESAIFFHLVENGESRSIWRREFQVVPPVELSNATLSPGIDGHPALRFRLNSTATKSEKLRVSLKEDGVELAAGEFTSASSASLELPQLKFGQPRNYEAELRRSSGASWKESLPGLNRFSISKVAVDTTLERWPAASVFDLAGGRYSRHSVNGEFDRPAGKLYLGWTKDYLLIRVAVNDKVHLASDTLEGLWSADSLQIGFAISRDEMVHPNNDGIQETSYTELGILPAADGKAVSRLWASSNRQLAELNEPVPAFEGKWTREDQVTVYSLNLPWSALNVKNPRADLPVKFSLLINDCDAIVDRRKQRHWLEWYGGIADGKDPALYGDAVLCK